MNRNDYPLPYIHPIKDWKEIPIQENKEELVSIQSMNTALLVVKPRYYAMGLPGAMSDCYVRREVALKLVEAARKLPDGYKLLIWDGWRPFSVQKLLYETYLNELKDEHPYWSEERLHEGARQFVSYPTVDEDAPPPHSTGGAVDLTILDENDEPLDMGTGFDEFSDRAWTRYFDEKKKNEGTLNEKEETYLQNRRLLVHVMTTSGFTNYSAEWWHFDYGNQWWAKQSDEPAAKYGLVNLEV
ncbi:M15 family metallopeptidase [Pseudalkalibacillus sp. SCS-8]|uniref:M15 family metallopeptidase n=1 Tax=Pseudalkalibacillus nanhaiensis TaxID=3115291 RepID=UPI0032DB365B